MRTLKKVWVGRVVVGGLETDRCVDVEGKATRHQLPDPEPSRWSGRRERATVKESSRR